MFDQNLNGWYNHFCGDCDNLHEISEIIPQAVSLSYRASIQHALWKDGKHIGFAGMIREKNMAKAECEIYLSTFLNEVIHMTDETLGVILIICVLNAFILSVYIAVIKELKK